MPTIQMNAPAPSAVAAFGQGSYARLSNPPGPRENTRAATGPCTSSLDHSGISLIMLKGKIQPFEEGYQGVLQTMWMCMH
jgi:hypothetical protein